MSLVIGIGNPTRGDDGAGSLAVRLLALARPDLAVRISIGEPAELMEMWDGADKVWLIDACAANGEPGRIHRFAAHEMPLPEPVGALSSHGFGLGTTIELARSLGALPRHLIVFAVEGADFTPGAPISPMAGAAAARVAEAIAAEIAAEIAAGA